FDVDTREPQEDDDEPIEAGPDPVGTVAHTLTRVIRGYDLAIRWSPQELVIVLPGVPESEAGRVAERVRAAIHGSDGPRVALTGGVAGMDDDASLDTMLARASESLRRSRSMLR